MKTPLVSVIVPIYNVEAYILKCIDSILGQTYTNIEVILVDDGSIDRSGEICDRYAQKDTRVKVFHQANGGVVKARNVGINLASGEYFSFVDSDDRLESTMYEKMIEKAIAKDLQIVWCDWFVVHENTGEKYTESCNYEEDNEKLLCSFLQDKIKGYLWNKLISKDFYHRCKIRTDADCKIMEDKFILLQLLYNNPKMEYVEENLYNYLLRTDSATGGLTKNPFIEGRKNVEHMYEFLSGNNDSEKYLSFFCEFVMKIKLMMVNSGMIKEALAFIPKAHININNYPIHKPMSFFYWLCFNSGTIGEHLLKLYKLK